ncbi:hypothetical protein [Halomonas daqiaonensis]|uniref:hypothetical protein n=1 Tax=Halomonas daqiaonensis TaxID=650850 RepID=UPI0011138397|nr:hypothetical protein [Halomonas daqiaonensis]
MGSYSKWLEGGIAVNSVFLTLAIAGISLSIYFYLQSKREKRPVFNVRTFPLIQNSLGTVPELSIAFKNKPVKTLSLTRLAFWNSGSETITKDDIVGADPLRIHGDGGGEILTVKVSFTRRSAVHLGKRCTNLAAAA